MYVVATAGHVDHGKSTLVQRLTGMWPDRLAEEQRRGLTIDLGFAWADIGGREMAFVDVPGHERFVANMLAGCGPMPPESAVMFVVAATEGWMPQSEEHFAALEALGVRHVLVVISKSDIADPAGAIAQVRERFPDAPIALSTDLDHVRAELVDLVGRLPAPASGSGWTAPSRCAVQAPSSPARSPREPSAWVTNSTTPGAASPCADCSRWGSSAAPSVRWRGWR